MTTKIIEDILSKLSHDKPPYQICILEQAASLNWISSMKHEIDLYAEIILRINADIICSNPHFSKIPISKARLKIYEYISVKIKDSSIINCTEFSTYFDKFQFYLSEVY